MAEKLEPDKKKLKTMIHSQKSLPNDNKDEKEGREIEEDGDPDICQHVKQKEKFDYYAQDAATEEQSREQASNVPEDEKEKDEEKMDIDMHEDNEADNDVEIMSELKAEKLNKPSNKKDKGSNKIDDSEMETTVDIEGEIRETMKVSRGTESSFHTKLSEDMDLHLELSSAKHAEQGRLEVERMLSEWTRIPTTEEAIAAWNALSAVTDVSARDLAEKLRLVLEPTQASRLRGDYRTGRRINMRKIIPYIASQFRKDKIWMRRTKPSKRDYQIVLAIDDSSSMADNHSKELAFESLCLISKAMTFLEAGQLSVLSFGERINVHHPLGEPFSERSGSRLVLKKNQIYKIHF